MGGLVKSLFPRYILRADALQRYMYSETKTMFGLGPIETALLEPSQRSCLSLGSA